MREDTVVLPLRLGDDANIKQRGASMQIKATYCTRYNGAYLSVADKKSDKCTNDIVNKLSKKCDDEGDFYGDHDDAVDTITNIVKKHYGQDTEVTVELDTISS